jgi:hypothetical protein
MRDLVIVTVLCLAAAILIDHFWFDGRYIGEIGHDVGLSIGAAKRH